MRNPVILALAMVLLIPGSGWCQDSEGPLGDPIPPPVQDPSLTTSHYFSPSLTHAGVANTGPALSANKGQTHDAGCKAANPCAVPTPALDRAVAARAG